MNLTVITPCKNYTNVCSCCKANTRLIYTIYEKRGKAHRCKGKI
uniref:Uncharacterized protein n=1 Tax=Siphoviridae sp. ctBrh2 TaxID=2827804 RepID=A0A8S5S7I3_9CAUD|nr:MAG TPA: hypothetical protein [Siphoviridae sp. ctBrh2]